MKKKIDGPLIRGSNVKPILGRFLGAQDRLVFQAADLSLGSLAGMTSKQTGRNRAAIDLAPDFQRRKRWTAQKQSALIESFLLNIPVPPIYLTEDAYGQYSVVDGKQRLTAIQAFMTEGMRLKGLETFGEIENYRFQDLPEDLQNALAIRPYVRVVTLLKQSDPNLKFEVFTRLNRGGEAMLPQELRKVAYRGSLSDLIFQLAENQFLRQQLKITSDSSPSYIRMEDAEYVLRFFTLCESWRTFSGSLRIEMDSYMRDNRELSTGAIRSLKNKFITTISACEKIWSQHAFQRHTGAGWRKQFLAGMYDAEMLAVASMSATKIAKAITHRQAILRRTAELFKSLEFDKAARQGTNTPSFLKLRVSRVADLIDSL